MFRFMQRIAPADRSSVRRTVARLLMLTAAMGMVVAALAGVEIAVLRSLGVSLRPEPLVAGSQLHSFSVSPNGRWCVSRLAFAPTGLDASTRSSLLLHDLRHPQQARQIDWQGISPRQVTVSSTGCVALSSAGQLYLWRSPATSSTLERLAPAINDVFTQLIWSTDGRRVAAATSGAVYVWEVSGQLLQRLPHPASTPLTLAFSDDGRQLAVAGPGAVCCIWDLRTGHSEPMISMLSDPSMAPAFSRDLRTVAFTGPDGSLRIYRDAEVAELACDPASSRIVARRLAISTDGGLLAAADSVVDRYGTPDWLLMRRIQIWDLHSGKIAQQIPWDDRDIQSVHFDDQQQLYLCDGKQIQVWNLAARRAVWQFRCEPWLRGRGVAGGPAALLAQTPAAQGL